MSVNKSARLFGRSAVAIALAAGATAALAGNVAVYNSIPKQLPPNVASEGPEAYGFAELGDGMSLGAAPSTLSQLTVVMSSWACQSGNWTVGCVTKDGAKFKQDITVNVYSVADSVDGLGDPTLIANQLLATATKTFDMPYRPTSTPDLCGGDAQVWYNKKDQTCYHGLAFPIQFDLSKAKLVLPQKVIIGVAYNTTHYGPNPIGEAAACYTTTAGCPYDSLNIGTDGDGGSVLDTTGIFVRYTIPNTACDLTAIQTGILELDAGCWTGYHPLIQINAEQKKAKPPKNPPAPV